MSEQTSERSEGREQSEQYRARERVSGASELANGQVNGPVLQSVFLVILAHSATGPLPRDLHSFFPSYRVVIAVNTFPWHRVSMAPRFHGNSFP